MVNLTMNFKGFTEGKINIKTPEDVNVTEEPLNSDLISSKRVDINVLKSKLKQSESKEFKKNIFILLILVLLIIISGVYLTL